MYDNFKKTMTISLCAILIIGCTACSQTKSDTTDLLGKAIENFKDALSYKSQFIVTMNMDTQKNPTLLSGDSVNYIEYIKEPFQMLFHPDVIDHHIYGLISQDENKIIYQSQMDDQTDTWEVGETAIEGNKAFYSFVIDLINQNIKNFKVDENSSSSSEKTIFKGEILPERAKNLYEDFQSQYGYGTAVDEILALEFYMNNYKDISSGSQPLPTIVTIDNKTNQIMKIEVDTTSAMKKAELISKSLEINETHMKSTLLLDSALTQEFSNYNQVKSIQLL